jgi:aromatic ring-opening dioxygenase catalytic subunit (LigB family)
VNIVAGETVTIEWQVSNAEEVIISQFGNQAPSGRIDSYTVSQTTSFTIEATNLAQKKIQRTIQVNVNLPTPTPVTPDTPTSPPVIPPTTAHPPSPTPTSSSAPAEINRTLLHVAAQSNMTGNWTAIDSELANNNPDAIMLVTSNWNPPGHDGVYNNHSIGVWYTGTRWAIYNQDIAAMPQGASFNVRILNAGSNSFVHTATSSNITDNWTAIDSELANNNPDAILMVTSNWNPSGRDGVYNNHPIGVWYTGTHWAIYNQDMAAMPQGASFNVRVFNAGESVFVHTATSSNITDNWTAIDSELANNNPDAIIMVTSNWNPPGHDGVYNDHPIGVWYTGTHWAIYNQDMAAMPQGASFNVLIFDSN